MERVRKGRGPSDHTERNRKIQQLKRDGTKADEIAKQFGITSSYVYLICSNPKVTP